jgi:hypothetical protein
VEEEHLLSLVDIDEAYLSATMSFLDIDEAYLSATIISTDYGFGNVTDKDDIPDLEAPTECEDEEKLSESNASCASEARLSNERYEDHDDDVEPPMSANDVKVDYEFHNDAAFVQVELSLEDEDVEEKSLSQIRPTLQALNSPNMWIGDTGATRHYTKYKQGGIDLRPSMSRTRGIKQLSQAWKLIFQECIVTSMATTSLQ